MTPFPRLVLGEATRQFRNPVLLLSAAAILAFRLATTWREMPVWSRALPDTSVSALALGSAVMLVAGLAVLRDRDPDVADFLASLPVGRAIRTAAVLCGSVLVALCTSAALVALQLAGLRIGSVPVGQFGLLEPLTGVATAVLMACLGVALTIWVPSPISAPLAIAFVFWTLLQFPDNWLLPVVPDQHLLVGAPRPPASHLFYVLALVVAVASIALMRGGLRWAAPAGLATVCAVVAGAATLSSPQAADYAALGDPHRPQDTVATARSTDCRTRDGVSFCALPPFAVWTPMWMAAVEPVVQAVPPAARATMPDVVQELPVGAVDPELAGRTAFVPTRWGRHGGETAFRRALAGQVAALATGLPSAKETDGLLGCLAEGQARVVVALWLVAQVETPVLPETEQEYVEDDHGGRQVAVTTSDLGFVGFGRTEVDLAERLAAEPAMADRIRAHWSELIAPSATVDDAVALLGIPAPPADDAAPASASGQEVCS